MSPRSTPPGPHTYTNNAGSKFSAHPQRIFPSTGALWIAHGCKVVCRSSERLSFLLPSSGDCELFKLAPCHGVQHHGLFANLPNGLINSGDGLNEENKQIGFVFLHAAAIYNGAIIPWIWQRVEWFPPSNGLAFEHMLPSGVRRCQVAFQHSTFL